MSGLTKAALLSYLQELGVIYQVYDHPVVMTVEEQASHIGHLGGALSKNLFLKDKKGRLYLVSAISTTNVDLKALSQRLGLGRGGLRMAPEDTLQEVLKVPLGSVTPLALINSSARSVILLLDHQLKNSPRVFFHPLINDASVGMSTRELDKFLRSIDREPSYVDLEAIVAVGKDQPPDLAIFITTPDEGTCPIQANGQAPAPVHKDACMKVVTTKPVLANKAAPDGTIKKLVEDPEKLLNYILDETLKATIEKIKKEVGDDWITNDLASSISSEVVKQISPDLKSILISFKNTAYTAGFIAGNSTR